jgi:hypothetical protein
VRDIVIACVDGLNGFPEAIEGDLAVRHGPDMHGAPDPGLDAIRTATRTAARSRLR